MKNRGSLHLGLLVMLVMTLVELRLVLPLFTEDYRGLLRWAADDRRAALEGAADYVSNRTTKDTAELRQALLQFKPAAAPRAEMCRLPEVVILEQRLSALQDRVAKMRAEIASRRLTADRVAASARGKKAGLLSRFRSAVVRRLTGFYI